MSISIIITCFNEDRNYLSQAIHSCLRQDVETEIIVVDSGSGSAPCSEIMCDIYARADIFISTFANLKQSGAMNLGIKNASGSYILTLDADNWLYPNALDKMLEAMSGNASVVCGNITNELNGAIITPPLVSGYNMEVFKSCNPIFTTSLFRKTAWELVGGFDEDVFYTDYNLWCKMFMKGLHFQYIDTLIYNHTIRKNSASYKRIDELEKLNEEARRPLQCINRVL